MTNVTILGSGAWGTTIGKVLAEAGNNVTIWGIEADVVAEINDHHTQSVRLPGVTLPSNLKATTDILDATSGNSDECVILVAIAAQHARSALSSLREKFFETWGDDRNAWPTFVSVMKGMEQSTGMMMGEMIAEVLGVPDDKIAAIAGPNLAKEIAKQMPAAATVASSSHETASKVASLFADSTYFETELSSDLKGVELMSCLKNVYALAAGYYAGKGYGDSTIATVVTKAMNEAQLLLHAIGGQESSATSYAGLGDMIATCLSPLSRNHSFGRKLGEGKSFDEAVATSDGVAEGVPTVSVVVKLANMLSVKMPVAQEVLQIVTA